MKASKAQQAIALRAIEKIVADAEASGAKVVAAENAHKNDVTVYCRAVGEFMSQTNRMREALNALANVGAPT